MVTKKRFENNADRWLHVDEALRDALPQLMSVLGSEDQFISLHIKLKEDRTTLGVLKRYGPDGGPTVCFGSGYGVSGCFVALEGSVAAGSWRPDKPWSPKKD